MKQKPNYALLRKIRDHILEEPKRVSMDVWVCKRNRGTPAWLADKYPQCGTIACIAGWAIALEISRAYGSVDFKFFEKAMEKLRLSYDQATSLFYTEDWPLPFAELIMTHKEGTEDYAKVVAARIDKFIESRGTV